MDYTVEDTIYLMFTTRAFATGIPGTLGGTPVVSAYENDSVTQITAGITLGVDHDSVTGLNLLTIVATAANGYESGKDYNLVITTGTVDSVSAVGEVVGTFSLGRSAAAADLANGTDGLGAIKADTAAVLGRIPAALVGGRMDANVGAVSEDTSAADNLETMLDGTGGSTLSLGKLNIVNASGTAIIASSTGGNGHGIQASGNGTGIGLLCQGGPTNGQGAYFQAQGTAEGLRCEATGSGGSGMSCFGNVAGAGFSARGGTAGHGIVGQGGVVGTQNNGIYGVGGTNAGDIGSGIKGDGGDSGAGIGGNGGPSAGAGIRGTALASGSPGMQVVGGSASHGLQAIGGSASGSGIVAAGGAAAGVGITIVGTGGSDAIDCTGIIDGDVTGDITGNLSGSVGSVNNPAGIADAVWDEVLTGAAHNVVNSAGRRLRQLQEAGSYAGAIWIDTVNGTAGTTSFENGTDTMPVNSLADADTLAAALGISRFRIAPGSSITLAASQQNQLFEGSSWTLALGGQNIDGSTFLGAAVSGIATNTAGIQYFIRCNMGAVTLPGDTHVLESGIDGPQTLGEAGDYFFDRCHSAMAGTSTPVLDFGAALNASNVNVRNYSGGIEIQNMGAGAGSYSMSLEGRGQLVINANCSATSTVAMRGHFTVTDNAGGAVTLSDDARIDVAQINAEVDTALADANLDHIAGTVTGIPAIPAGTYLDQIMDDGTESFDRTTDSLQAIRDTAPLGATMRGTDDAALASVATEARLSELDAATGGKMANQVDLVKTEADKIALADAGAGVSGSVIEEIENRATPAQVNTEVLDVLSVDTFAEPGQETPAATTTLAEKIGYVFKFLRNRVTQTSTEIKVYADNATTVDQKSTHSDDGTTYDRGEFGSGP